MKRFYVTKAINENLDMRLITNIQLLIATMEVEEGEYLLIFI